VQGVSVEQMEELADQRYRDPNEVVRRATELLVDAGTPEVEAAGRRALGLALHELGRLPAAVENYRLAIETSVKHGLVDIEAQARAALAGSLVVAGDADGATEQIALARTLATGATRGLVEMTYGLVLERTGRLADAQVVFTRSLRWLEGTEQLASIARLRMNRGILRAYQGDANGAVEDFATAEKIARKQQLPVLVAMASHNLGFAHARRGDLPQALSAFVQAEEAYAALAHAGPVVAVLEADRCEVLLVAGLIAEAGAAAKKAVHAVALSGDIASLNECRLLLARALLAGNSFREASDEATAVAIEFRKAGSRPWAAMADYVSIQAEVLGTEDQQLPPAGLLDRCQAVAHELEGQGWTVEAVHVRTFVGRLALALDQALLARSELAQAVMARRRGTADLKARAWHATALLLIAEGDRPGAKRAVSHGLRVVQEHLASLGGTELRARAASHGSELARLGTLLALEERKPSEVLRAVERWKASSLRCPPVCPPQDDQLVGDLAELRGIRSQLRDAALAGALTENLQRVAVTIETRVRRRLRQTRGEGLESARFDLAHLRGALGRRTLVEYVSLEGRAYAVVVRGSRSRLVQLAPLGEVEREQAYLMFALRRAQRERQWGTTGSLLAVGANRLDDMLVAPLRLPDDEPLVVVPTGALHRLPWGCLPSLVARDVTVAPSAALWAQRPHRTSRPGGEPPSEVTLVSGPGLPGAEAEVARLAELYPQARLLMGADATVTNVLDCLGRSQLVHLAAHGSFRADNPLFSSVLLSDGPLTVYDLERVPLSASTVVLASCNAGVSGVQVGDELMGTAATLLALGVRSVVAPLVEVPDMPTATFMVAFHCSLLDGMAASTALAMARCGDEREVASVFLCIGRDNQALSNETTSTQQ
jgi:CHAT domain-containing protein